MKEFPVELRIGMLEVISGKLQKEFHKDRPSYAISQGCAERKFKGILEGNSVKISETILERYSSEEIPTKTPKNISEKPNKEYTL